MFSNLTSSLRSDLAVLRKSLEFQDSLRRAIHPQIGEVPPYAIDPAVLAAMQAHSPDRLSWQLLDHCTAVSRGYALFEGFVDELVRAYVQLLPKVTPDYLQLIDSVRVQYRIGVGTLLGKWGVGSSYSHLSEASLADGLVEGLNSRPYSLLAEAFLTDSSNYRADTLTKLFGRFGIEGIFDWVKATQVIEDYCANELSGAETADSFLSRLVALRNEAAHSKITQVSSIGELTKFIEFLALVGEVLATRLRDELIVSGTATNCSRKFGRVVHRWSNNIVGIEALCTGSIQVGQELYFGADRLSRAIVQSVQHNNVAHQSLQVAPGTKFAAALDVKVVDKANVYERLTI